jgi:hypothetical protein
MSVAHPIIVLSNKERHTMNKYELEQQFKALALAHYNRNTPAEDVVDERSPYFQSYLDAMVWGMVPREEIVSWIDYYQRKAVEENV